MRQITKSVVVILIMVALLAFGIVSLVGCGGGSSQDDRAAIISTITQYNAAYNAQDFNKCLDYVTGWRQKDSMIYKLQSSKALTGNITIDRITNIFVTGQTASALVTSSTAKPDVSGRYTNIVTSRFMKDGDTWKYVIVGY